MVTRTQATASSTFSRMKTPLVSARIQPSARGTCNGPATPLRVWAQHRLNRDRRWKRCDERETSSDATSRHTPFTSPLVTGESGANYGWDSRRGWSQLPAGCDRKLSKYYELPRIHDFGDQ